MDRHFIGRWALGMTFGVVAGAVACGPSQGSGACSDDLDCTRGERCELATSACVTNEVDTTSTENPAPASFSGKPVPFHRGEICLPMEVQSGAPLPVLMRPCVHPCLSVSSFNFRHNFQCVGSSCDADVVMWMTASGSDCPADAFGEFSEAQCVYDTEVGFQILTETSNGPIRGEMRLEVPFLSNADMVQIVPDPDDRDVVEALIHQYPDDSGRIPDGRSVSVMSDHPIPPESCAEGACPCFPIGF